MIDKKFKFNLGASVNGGSSGGGGATLNLKIEDEGTLIQQNVDTINFVGADVEAQAGGSGTVVIYIPPPTFASHFNTQDGTTDARVRQGSTTVATRFISVPTSEGNPFNTGGTANTNALASNSSAITLTPLSGSNGEITAMQNSTFTINVTEPDGTTMETFTTSTITGNGTFTSPSGDIVVTVSNYGADTTKFKANVSIFVTFSDILNTAGYEGGSFNILITHNTQSDGTFSFNLNTSTNPTVQAPFFYDTNTPLVSFPQNVAIAETGGSVTTKFISGLEYYTTGSQFTISCDGLDNFNRNTALTNNNLKIIDNSTFGFSTFFQSPLPSQTGNANFTGWTNAYNNTGVSYSNNGVSINRSNFRFAGTNGRINIATQLVWSASERTTQSSNTSILVDTFGNTSTALSEDFNDETYRTDTTFVNGSWTSSADLVSGDAMVYFGQLICPTSATLSSGGTNTDWTTFAPNAGGQPDYTGYAVTSNYYRRVPESSGLSKSSFTIVFDGGSSFVGANALADLINSNIEIFIRRINSSDPSANTGASAPPLRLHTANQYNFATFDDGNTVAGSYIRTGSSSGNTIEGTFGSFDCQDGLLLHIRLNNTQIKLSGFDVVFN
jgi:hypothetical protein